MHDDSSRLVAALVNYAGIKLILIVIQALPYPPENIEINEQMFLPYYVQSEAQRHPFLGQIDDGIDVRWNQLHIIQEFYIQAYILG